MRRERGRLRRAAGNGSLRCLISPGLESAMHRPFRVFAPVLAGLALLACSQGGSTGGGGENGPALTDPSQATVSLERRFAPEAEAAQATGVIGWSEAYRMGGADGAGETVLTVAGENGVRLEALLVGPLATTATVAGQTVSHLMALAEGAEPAHYRITSAAGASLCGAAGATDLVAFETTGSPPETLALLITTGGSPGETSAQLCQVLRYTRTGG
jgi:hypothetical protein